MRQALRVQCAITLPSLSPLPQSYLLWLPLFRIVNTVKAHLLWSHMLAGSSVPAMAIALCAQRRDLEFRLRSLHTKQQAASEEQNATHQQRVRLLPCI